jgi:hypothetical protein
MVAARIRVADATQPTQQKSHGAAMSEIPVSARRELQALVAEGRLAFDKHLATFEGQMAREGTRDGEIIWSIEVIDPEVRTILFTGLAAHRRRRSGAEQGDFTEPDARM